QRLDSVILNVGGDPGRAGAEQAAVFEGFQGGDGAASRIAAEHGSGSFLMRGRRGSRGRRLGLTGRVRHERTEPSSTTRIFFPVDNFPSASPAWALRFQVYLLEINL